jgi:hypothetical protein
MYTIQGDTVYCTRTKQTRTQTVTITDYFGPLTKTVGGKQYVFNVETGEYEEVSA